MKESVAAFFALRQILKLATASLKNFDIQAKADAQLMTVLASTNHAAGRSFEQLKEQASALQGVTLFGDEVTQGAQAIMLSFQNVREEIFDRSIPAIQDMATFYTMDLKTAALALGKALDSPAEAYTALTRAGVKFSKVQANMIKEMVEAGNIAGAQAFILDELATKTKGAAQTAAQSGLGAFQQLGNAWADFTERIGAALAAAFDPVRPLLTGLLNGFNALFDFIGKNADAFRIAAKAASIMTVTLGTLKISAHLTGASFAKLAVSVQASARAMTAAIQSIPIVGWVILIGTAVYSVVKYFYDVSGTFRGLLWGIWEAVKSIFGGIGEFISEVFNGIWHMIRSVFNPKNWFDKSYKPADGLKKITDAATKYGEKIGRSFQEGREKGRASVREGKAGKSNGSTSGPAVLDIDGSAGWEDYSPGIRPVTVSDDGQEGIKLSGSGNGGGGKSITMNVTQNNYFNGNDDPQTIAETIFRQLNDRFRDSALAIN